MNRWSNIEIYSHGIIIPIIKGIGGKAQKVKLIGHSTGDDEASGKTMRKRSVSDAFCGYLISYTSVCPLFLKYFQSVSTKSSSL